jgi:hypothetical protein
VSPSNADSFNRIKQWVVKCNEVKKVEPSIVYFEDLIKRSIERATNTRIKPLRFEETLKHKNRELYDILK